MSSKIDAFFAKYSRDIRKDLGAIHGIIWERDADVKSCRSCGSGFHVLRRRHHCRGCGGVFCEQCLAKNIMIDDTFLLWACAGCQREETPGEIIKKLVEENIASTDLSLIQRQKRELALAHGSKFESASSSSSSSSPPPTRGYFEFYNKSEDACAIKVAATGLCNVIWEAPRPAYIAVESGKVVSGFFDESVTSLDITILSNYPSLQSPARQVKIALFRDFSVHRVHCRGLNVLLKYKNQGEVEPRSGGTIQPAIGFISKLTGGVTLMNMNSEESHGDHAIDGSIIDFRTNVTAVDLVFKSFHA